MSKKIFFVVLILLSFNTSLLNSQETEPPKTLLSNEPSISAKLESSSAQDMEHNLRMDVAVLKEKVETMSTMMNLLIGILLAILAIGGLSSATGWFFTERRTREAHKLAMTGEQASQERAEDVHQTFLKRSEMTLDLVNSTLTLAKEASERAAKFIETKARTTLEELDKKSKALIAIGPKQLVAEPAFRSRLHSLAQKIAGFEINLFILPPEFKLTPDCLFIRGMDFHLNQQFDDALDSWNSVALRDDTSNPLKSLAWYWIGCEYNNLGKFSDACRSFERASEITTGAHWYELQRIIIESRFFDKKETTEALILPLQGLLDSLEKESGEEFKIIRAKIPALMGSIYFQLGNELKKVGKNIEAKERYNSAKEQFQEVSSQNKWALFGLAETLYRLGEEKEAEPIFQNLRLQAVDEYIRKEEPRIKVQARTTELICCLRIPSLRNEVSVIHSQLIDALGRVDEQLTVYSQMQNRNVSKNEFRKDLAELMAEQNRSPS